MSNLEQYSSEQLFDFYCERNKSGNEVKFPQKNTHKFRMACLKEYSRRAIERRMGFPVKVGNRYVVVPKNSFWNDKVSAGVWENNNDKDCDNGTVPAGAEIILTDENLIWDESFVYGTWNGKKVALAMYHLRPV